MLVTNDPDTGKSVIIQESTKRRANLGLLGNSDLSRWVGGVTVLRLVLVQQKNRMKMNVSTSYDKKVYYLNRDGIRIYALTIEALHTFKQIICD